MLPNSPAGSLMSLLVSLLESSNRVVKLSSDKSINYKIELQLWKNN